MNIYRFSKLLGALALITDSVVFAQRPSAPAQTSCELHVWPSTQVVVTSNLGGASLGLVGAVVDDIFAVKSPAAVEAQMTKWLNPDIQADVLKRLDLPSRLRLPKYVVVVESAATQPIWTLERLKNKQRAIQSKSICYAEMSIISEQYFNEALRNRLRTFIFYREYGVGDVPVKRVLDATATGLQKFPAKSEPESAAAASEIQAAFQQNISKFVTDKVKR